MKSIFEGTGVAIVTPFNQGRVDYVAFENIINRDISLGAKAIIVLGTTGEGATVNDIERRDIIGFAKSIIDGRAKLIVGTGNCNFETSFYNTHMAKQLGADGALVVTPYYNKTSQQGLIEYYSKLAKIGLPIIMYNVPSRTGLNIELDTVKKLLQDEMICGIKESTSDINRIIELCRICKDKIAVYSGEDSLNYIFYVLGASGCISVTANICADRVQKVYDFVKNKQFDEALKEQEKLSDLNQLMFIETNPVPVKTFMAQKGLIINELRMPLVMPSCSNSEKIKKYIDEEEMI